ncbi:MAG TPA: TlpA disulfide reductase family protein [Solirubrobacterales bacterium]|nr:TlpA disulfide reductase family protein [Solirubrobacterales bacterium]
MSLRSSASLVAVAALVGLLAYGLQSKGGHSLAIGEPAPTVTLPKLEGGGEGSLASYRGRWVLVNFWASWCPPCREEAPALEEFQKQRGNAEFTLLGIDSGDLSDDGKAFVDRYGISYPQLHDGQGSAADDFGTSGFPESFLIDPEGRLRLMWKGPVTLDELNDEVVPLSHQKKNPRGAA